MRFSRPCYDKYHRCPGWAGGGLKYAKAKRCNLGYISYKEPLFKWRFHKCPKCKVVVLPFVIRWIDPTWLWSDIKWRIRTHAS